MDGMIAPSVLEFHLFNNMFIFFYVGGMKKTHMFHLPRVPLISWGWCHTFALMKLFHGWCIASYGLTSLIEKSSGTGTTSRKSNLISLMFLQMVATILSGYEVMQPTKAKIKILLWFALEVYWMMKLIPLENAFPWYFAGRNLECIELYIYLIPIWCWGSWWFPWVFQYCHIVH